MQASLKAANTGLSGPVAFGAGLLLLASAPVIRGGNRYVALIPLEWLALLVLWLLACALLIRKEPLSGSAAAPLSRSEWVLVLSPLWAALFFLTPLPKGLWSALPGREIYWHAPTAKWLALSLTPDATVASLLASLPVVAVFVLARTASAGQIGVLTRMLVLVAASQAVWGLLQLGPFKMLYFGAEFAGGPIGGFANANHFASFITMTLPLAIFFLWQALPASHAGHRHRPPAAALLWSIVLIILVTAVLVSGSRTGLVTATLVTLLSMLLLLGAVPTHLRRWYLLGAGVFLLAGLVIVGLKTLVTRFDLGILGDDASFRWKLIGSSWQAALSFWPVGSGPGSYAAVFPRFQPPGLRGFAEHAHNDYVQLLMEFGWLFVVFAMLALWLFVRQGISFWQKFDGAGREIGAMQLQLCCAFGALAVLLHSWVDFNLRIPAIAMMCACLLGVFLRPLPPAGVQKPAPRATN